MRYVLIGLLSASALLVSVPSFADTRAPEQSSAGWPGLGPSCPERAPEGARFVRRVQPPLGLGYDLYVVTNADGSESYIPVYCFGR
ncbi:hypothetical protein [Nonomuraea sp. NPDC050310]|uniref:hypothetical protein n=1 Tax=unclassified Nonomuraea TaxID=2593643 RepID=UPI003400D198